MQDRGIIRHTREQKMEAMERFKDFQPTGGFNIPEHACQYIKKSRAMAWLLRQVFDEWGEMRRYMSKKINVKTECNIYR